MKKIKLGNKAPNFSLPDVNGKIHKLSDYLGKWVAIYFYPRDNTPGCTMEACSFRDNWSKLSRLGAVVLGISKDSVASHKKFAKKYKLPFSLLSDEKAEVIKKYGAWQKKKMAGREYFGTARISFLIDPQGKITKIYTKVVPTQHALEVWQDVKLLKLKQKS